MTYPCEPSPRGNGEAMAAIWLGDIGKALFALALFAQESADDIGDDPREIGSQ
jgi:hypothetical protein